MTTFPYHGVGAQHWIEHVLAGVESLRRLSLRHVRHDPGHSNDILELSFDDGRTLIVKCARHDWVADCFATAAAAARLIGASSDLIVPQPLDLLHTAPSGLPVQAYWRIPLPTLAQLWPALSHRGRQAALKSCAALLKRLHALPASAYGPLAQPDPAPTLDSGLDRDLRQRLLPAVAAHWPEGFGELERLIELIPLVQNLAGARPPVLVHRDLHMGNVLCRATATSLDCVGLLDLDGVSGGAPEYDIAGFDVLHGRIFQHYLPHPLRRQFWRACGGVDGRLLDYFRCVHLANQGFTSAFLEHAEHAAEVGAELRRQMRSLERRLRSPAAASDPPALRL